MIYRAFLAIRHFLYDKGRKKSFRASVPTVDIGNLAAGGTGKTPHTEMIIRLLLRSDDWAYSDIAVLSRGYKRKSRGFQKVPMDGTATLYGDEPVQIARKFPIVTVAVAKDRVEGCRRLAEGADENTAPSKLILLDDAFQYRRLRADMDIVLTEFGRPIFKDRLLPLGRLRDLPSRIHRAAVTIVTKCPPYIDEWERGKWAAKLGIDNYSTATYTGTDSKTGKPRMLFFSLIGYLPMEPVFPEADSRYMYSKRLILLTGIARSAPLAGHLSDHYSIVREFRFRDHHRFTKADIRSLEKAVRSNPTACIATTEKDAQRLLDTKKMPLAIRERLFKVPIEVRFVGEGEDEAFGKAFLSLLSSAGKDLVLEAD